MDLDTLELARAQRRHDLALQDWRDSNRWNKEVNYKYYKKMNNQLIAVKAKHEELRKTRG